MTKIRGGSQALQFLSAALIDIANYATEIKEHPANVQLVALDAEFILEAVELIRGWRDATMEPMMERREKAGPADVSDLADRIARVEQAIIALQTAATHTPIVRLDERRGQGGGR